VKGLKEAMYWCGQKIMALLKFRVTRLASTDHHSRWETANGSGIIALRVEISVNVALPKSF
jgi:hypothetical protein